MKLSTGAVLNVVLATSIVCVAVSAVAQENTPSLVGKWQNAGTTLNVTATKGELEGRFTELGAGASGLGFKMGELSLKAAQRGPFLIGEQTIRYGPPCYREGRKVPVIGRVTPDGQVLALHYYNIRIGADCRDTGEYDITETLWRKAGR
jgi:hypothetical protein